MSNRNELWVIGEDLMPEEEEFELISAVSYENDNSEVPCETLMNENTNEDGLAVEGRMIRSSSCFFSVKSGYSNSSYNDLRGLVIHLEQKEQDQNNDEKMNAISILHHDILMQVLSYLNTESLASFSKTCRRCNFECFYSLQFQLEQALLLGHHKFLQPCKEILLLKMLNMLDSTYARSLVDEFLETNASLEGASTPLQKRLELFFRAFLASKDGNPNHSHKVKAAMAFTFLGGACATAMSGSIDIDIHNAGQAAQALLSFGLGASMLKAASDRSSRLPSLSTMFQANENASTGSSQKTISNEDSDQLAYYEMDHPLSSDPYHNNDAQPSNATRCISSPTGCIRSYMFVIERAKQKITSLVKQQRRKDFCKLTKDDQNHLSTNFVDACASDDNLALVISLVQQNGVDVDSFYVGSDGTETCGLHTATFNGATKILEFLCRGIDCCQSKNDGGLCNVNLQDNNGWTALHFAAGSNSVQSVTILSNCNANLTIEAENGYTPYHWAERLSNKEVATKLETLGADKRFLSRNAASSMMMRPSSALSNIANRFFNIIPPTASTT